MAQWLAAMCLIGAGIGRWLKPDLKFGNGLAMAALSIVASAACSGPTAVVFVLLTFEGGFLLATGSLGAVAGGALWAFVIAVLFR
jgi:hypothetical protein